MEEKADIEDLVVCHGSHIVAYGHQPVKHISSLKRTISRSSRRESANTTMPSAITPSHVLLLVFSFSDRGTEGVPGAPHFSQRITL